MAKTLQRSGLVPFSPSVLWTIRILAFAGLLISGYLAWTSLSGATLMGCGEQSGCDEVTQTKWSYLFGMPVSAGAVAVYAGIFTISLLSQQKQTHRSLLVFLTVMAAGSAIWFILLQMLVVKSYCMYCMTVHVCSIVLAILVFKRQAMKAALAGVVGVAFLIGGQLLSATGYASDRQQASTPVPAPQASGQKSSAPAKTKAPEVETHPAILMNGQFTVQVGEFPVLGNSKAERTVAHFFDYTCPACRQLHPSLLAAHKKVENEVALVMIPMPLDSECNSAIRETSYQHQNACLFARLGLAIWNVDPELFKQYDEYMFRWQYPPSAEQAVSFVYELVGKDAINAEMTDSRNGEVLRRGIDMFNLPVIEQKVLPVLVTPKNAVYGVPKVDDVSAFLAVQMQ